MLPLTRNIFRQTATPFNNATKRWKQESYYIQIKWSRVAVLKNLHVSIEGTMLKVGSSRRERVTSVGKKEMRRVVRFGGFPTDDGAEFVW